MVDVKRLGWTSYLFEDGERALVRMLAEQYQVSALLAEGLREARFCDAERPCKSWVWHLSGGAIWALRAWL